MLSSDIDKTNMHELVRSALPAAAQENECLLLSSPD